MDAGGNELYGPLAFPKSATLTLTNVPIEVTQLRIEHLLGQFVIGVGVVPVVVRPDQTTIVVDPDFQDEITAFQVIPNSPTIAKGTSVQFQAMALLRNNRQLDLSSAVSWQSSSTSVATVSGGGLATGVTPGTTLIEASLGSLTGSTSLQVSPAAITSIVVNPPSPTIADGNTLQFTATANLSDGSTQIVTTGADWTSSAPAKATINQSGLATGVDRGQTTITAAVEDVSGSTVLEITQAQVVSVEVTPIEFAIGQGTTEQFSATAEFSDGSIQNVTNASDWTSEFPGIASVSAGLISPGSLGTTTITATFGSHFGQALLTVLEPFYTTLERVSVNSSGEQTNSGGFSHAPSLSGDGQFVAFESVASNLVAGDTNGAHDIFVKDRSTAGIVRVSNANDGSEANDHSTYPSISADGTLVAFQSDASNLSALEPNGTDIYLYNKSTNLLQRINVNSSGEAANGSGFHSVISGNGQFVVFYSAANNLVPFSSGGFQIFLYDRTQENFENISVSALGSVGNGNSRFPDVSDDGRFVAFESVANNLVAGDNNSVSDVFVVDRTLGTIERVSAAETGEESNGDSLEPAISSDGRFVAFQSHATNLVPGDSGSASDIYLYDRQNDTLERVSQDNAGGEGNADSRRVDLSADGRFIVYESAASNFGVGENDARADIFLYDRERGRTEQISVTQAGQQIGFHCEHPTISRDARVIAFQSSGKLVAAATHSVTDIYVVENPYLRSEP